MYHDLHNHIEAIYQCLIQGDTTEAVRYCEDLRTPVRQISQTVWTGDKALDYLISSKMALAEQEQIKTKVNIEYPHNTNIRSVDLTTILGNLLDNALEAAKAAPESLRFLNLTIRRINAMLIIKVENGYGNTLIQENGKLLTSKKDKAFHGWGLKKCPDSGGSLRWNHSHRLQRSCVPIRCHLVFPAGQNIIILASTNGGRPKSCLPFFVVKNLPFVDIPARRGPLVYACIVNKKPNDIQKYRRLFVCVTFIFV